MPSTSLSASLDHVITAISNDGNQEQFTNLYRFMNGALRSGSYVELVALQTGSGGTGTDYHDEGNPFGQNAFAVWRFVTGSIKGSTSVRTSNLYMLQQWADSTAFGNVPGDPAVLDNGTGDGCGIAIAWRADGDNPWNGTTNADGDDSKGSPVWSVGGDATTLYVLPRSNATGGNRSTNKECVINIVDQTSNPTRYHYFADRDNLLIVVDTLDNTGYDRLLHFGTYDPLPGISGSVSNPIVMIRETTTPLINTQPYGSTTSTSTRDGGVKPAVESSNEILTYYIDRYDGRWATSGEQPNNQYTVASYDQFRVPIITSESPVGCVGYFSFFDEVYGNIIDDITADGSGTIIGPGSTNYHCVVPWISGSTALRSTSTREGRVI